LKRIEELNPFVVNFIAIHDRFLFDSVRSGKSHLLMSKLAEERSRLLETQKVRVETSSTPLQLINRF
jgi:hypothetical protein